MGNQETLLSIQRRSEVDVALIESSRLRYQGKKRTPDNYLVLFYSSCALTSYFTESTILGPLFCLSSYKVFINFKAIYKQTYFLLFSP